MPFKNRLKFSANAVDPEVDTLRARFGWKKIASRLLGAVVIVVAVGCLLRVMIWENDYYARMEGSERATTGDIIDNGEEIDETEPTEEEIDNYTVAPDRPRYLSIPDIGLERVRVVEVGVTSEGKLATPNNNFDAGWYYNSSKPGGGGTLLIDGHSGVGSIGVFKNLPELVLGAEIIIERGDGAIFTYEVAENVQIALDEANAYMATAQTSPLDGQESITLITCSGDWSLTRKTYLSRQFVRAVLVSSQLP